MKNFLVKIVNRDTKEEVTSYTIQDDTLSTAKWRGRGRFKLQYPEYIDPIMVKGEETKRNLIPVQDPQKWQFVED